jgi:hypothetical protein
MAAAPRCPLLLTLLRGHGVQQPFEHEHRAKRDRDAYSDPGPCEACAL